MLHGMFADIFCHARPRLWIFISPPIGIEPMYWVKNQSLPLSYGGVYDLGFTPSQQEGKLCVNLGSYPIITRYSQPNRKPLGNPLGDLLP